MNTRATEPGTKMPRINDVQRNEISNSLSNIGTTIFALTNYKAVQQSTLPT
jgi:hypothetical protein